jgi:hypothetical protein
VKAVLGLTIDDVGFLGARRLGVIGEAQDDQHDAGSHEDGCFPRHGVPPLSENSRGRLQDGDGATSCTAVVDGGEHILAGDQR